MRPRYLQLATIALLTCSSETNAQVQQQGEQGYALHFQGENSIAGIRNGQVDFTSNGFNAFTYNYTQATLSYWILWHPIAEAGQAVSWAAKSDNYIIGAQLFGSWIRIPKTIGYFPNETKPYQEHGKWWFTTFTFDMSGNETTIKVYLNGEFASNEVVSGYTLYDDNVTFYLGSLSYVHGPINKQCRSNLFVSFMGAMDDFSLWNTVLSNDEIKNLMRGPLEAQTTRPENLVLHYNFDVQGCIPEHDTNGLRSPSCGLAGDGIIKNHGISGSDYDLILGGLNDDYGFGTTYISKYAPARTPGTPFDVPGIAPSTVPYTNSTNITPIVFQILSTETVNISLVNENALSLTHGPFVGSVLFGNGTAIDASAMSIESEDYILYKPPLGESFTQPVWFSLLLNDNTTQEYHIWPYFPPKLNKNNFSISVEEEGESKVNLGKYFVSPTGEKCNIRFLQLPKHGKLRRTIQFFSWERGLEIDRERQTFVDSANLTEPFGDGLIFDYVPNAAFSGQDSFTLEYFSPSSNLTSKPFRVEITVQAIDDLPVAITPGTVGVMEDAEYVDITINGTDEESKFGLALFISRLPKKGKLYVFSENGEELRVDRAYSRFDFGLPYDQYVESIVGFSSFLDNFRHPLNMIGEGFCNRTKSKFGACYNDKMDYLDFVIPDGTLVHANVFANDETLLPYFDKGVTIGHHVDELGNQTYDVSFFETFRQSPLEKTIWEPCVIHATHNLSLPVHPQNCSREEVHRESPRIVRGIPRIFVDLAGGRWAPFNGNYKGNVTFTAKESHGKYGGEYFFKYNQADTYEGLEKPKYTEYVEVKFQNAVFPVSLDIGLVRGVGGIVAIKALSKTSGKWQYVYTGSADKGAKSNYYYEFTNSICAPTFRTDTLRIEMDTSEETGVNDFTEIDYVKLTGSDTMQHAVLRSSNNTVRYKPNRDAFGRDRFTFETSDCFRDRKRDSIEEATVEIAISEQDDPPKLAHDIASDERILCGEHDGLDFKVAARGVDGYDVKMRVSSLPWHGMLVYETNTVTRAPSVLRQGVLTKGGTKGESVEHTYSFKYVVDCDSIIPKDILDDQTYQDNVTFTLEDRGMTSEYTIVFKVLKTNFNYVSDGTKTICLSMFAVNVLVSAICLYWIIAYRATRVVRASQGHFLFLVISGALISSSTIPFLILDDSNNNKDSADSACNLSIWLYCTGFALTFGSLYVKTFRIDKLFDLQPAASGRGASLRKTTSVPALLLKLILLVSVDIVICLVWTTTDPLEYSRNGSEVRYSGEKYSHFVVESSATCSSKSEDGSAMTYLGIIACYHILVLLYLAYYCFRTTRHNTKFSEQYMATAFSETRYIRASIFSALQITLLAIPVLMIIQDSPDTTAFVRSGVIFLNDFTIQVLIFGPKIFFTFYATDPRDTKVRSSAYASDSSFVGQTAASSVTPSKLLPANAILSKKQNTELESTLYND